MLYFTYRYLRKKYRERQEREAAERLGTPDALPQRASPDVQQPVAKEHSAGTSVTATASSSEDGKKGKKELTPEQKAKKKRKRMYRFKIILGLFAPFTLQALDTTIIASAMPFIAADFNQINQLNWIISSFNLTAAAFLPFWAQVADIWGRHYSLQASLVVMTIGSAICTGSPTNTYGLLLVGRALQGVGCAGVNICVRTILADRVSLADYALNWTIFALFSAVSFSIGPVIGGYLTQSSWRWCFGINLPVAAVAIVGVALLLRKELLGPQPLPELEGVDVSRRRNRFTLRLATLDYGGQLLFLWGLGLLILAFTWAGGQFAWGSPAVLAPLVIGAVLTPAWLVYEYLMVPGRLMARTFPLQRAMMPWELLVQRDIGMLFIVNFGVGMAMFAVMYFMDLYFALVQGNSPSTAGIALLYFLPGLGAGAYSSMFFSNVWPRQTIWSLILGGITSAVGITVLAWANFKSNLPLIYGMMALTGYGVGIRLNASAVHGLAYFPSATTQITCLLSFATPFGGAISLTLMSTVFNNKSGLNHENPNDGILWAFVAIIPFMWVILGLTLFMGNVWIRKDGGHDVVNGAYLWSLVFRKKLVKERKVRGESTETAGGGEGIMSGGESTPEKKAVPEGLRPEIV